MTPSGLQTVVLTPEVAGHDRRASGTGRAFSDGAGHGQRPPGRVQAFSPGFDPTTELGTGALGLCLSRYSEEVSAAHPERQFVRRATHTKLGAGKARPRAGECDY